MTRCRGSNNVKVRGANLVWQVGGWGATAGVDQQWLTNKAFAITCTFIPKAHLAHLAIVPNVRIWQQIATSINITFILYSLNIFLFLIIIIMIHYYGTFWTKSLFFYSAIKIKCNTYKRGGGGGKCIISKCGGDMSPLVPPLHCANGKSRE